MSIHYRGVLNNDVIKARAKQAIDCAPQGYFIEIKEATRTTDQNALLWPLLTAVSKQVDWYGRKLKPEEWKHVFTASLKKQDVVPGIDGGFVVLGLSTSVMTKSEFSNLIEVIYAFGAEQGVVFDQQEVAA